MQLPKILLTCALLLHFGTSHAQYELTVHLKGAPADSAVYLGYSYQDGRYVKDTAIPDKQGKVVFKGKHSLPKGMYFVALHDHSFFEVLMGEQQKFAVDATAGQLFETLTFKGSTDNQTFLEYQKFLGRQQLKANKLQDRLRTNEAAHQADSVATLRAALDQVDKEVKDYINQLLERNPHNFLGNMMRSLQNVEVPTMVAPPQTTNPDSVRRLMAYTYLRNHYFDNINFAESGLIRTPFFKSKVDYFFDKMVLPDPDTIIYYAGMLIGRAASDSAMYEYMTEYFFQRYQKSEIMGHDKVVVYLADTYYLSGKAAWASAEYKEKIKKRADQLRHNLIGNKAPELMVQDIDKQYISLHKQNAEFIILYFYEPNCGHCRKETPKLWEWYNKYRGEGIEVMAFYTQYNRKEWEKYVLEDHQYDWVNVWDGFETQEGEQIQTFSIGTNFRELYDIYSTPAIYVLDKNKRILAKRLGIESLKSVIDYYRQHPLDTTKP